MRYEGTTNICPFWLKSEDVGTGVPPFLTSIVLVNPFSQSRQPSVLNGTVVLKNRIPSAPIGMAPLPLEPSAATAPRSCTKGSPVTRFHWEPGFARTMINHSSPAVNELAGTTKPSDPARSDL